MALFGEIIKLIMERKEHFRGANKEKYAPLLEALSNLLKEVHVWTWIVWLPSMIIQFLNARKNCGLDSLVYQALEYAVYVYPEFTHRFLSVVTNSDITNDTLDEIMEKLRESNINKMKYNDTFLSCMSSVYEKLGIEDSNENQETFAQLYETGQIDSRSTNEIVTKSKKVNKSYGQFKNQDNSEKIISVLAMVQEHIEKLKIEKRGKVSIDLSSLPVNNMVALPADIHIYKEKSIRYCMKTYYMVPDINIVYTGRRFKLELQFSSLYHKTVKFTFERRPVDSLGQYIYSHYSKLINVQLVRFPETLYRDIKFLKSDRIFFDDDYFMTKKHDCDEYLIDMLDKKLTQKNLNPDHPIKILAETKSVPETNQTMKQIIKPNFLKNEILKRLNAPFDLFYWRKRYAQNLAINAMNSLIFGIEEDFESLRLSFDQGMIINDSLSINMENVGKNVAPQLPLRLTQNSKFLLKEYMIEGVVIPTMMSIGMALKKVNKEFDYEVVMGLYIRDFLGKDSEEPKNVDKFIANGMKNYYKRVVKMAAKYWSEKGEGRVKFKEMNCLKGYVEYLEDEEYQDELPLSYRVWV